MRALRRLELLRKEFCGQENSRGLVHTVSGEAALLSQFVTIQGIERGVEGRSSGLAPRSHGTWLKPSKGALLRGSEERS